MLLFCTGCATEFKTHYTMKVTTYYDRPTCVFGAVDTPNGRAIADEMLAWITPEYNTHVVWHDGRMFEYHALRYAQELAMREDIPVLYLHTKGACNKPERSALIRKMWRREFAGTENSRSWGIPMTAVTCTNSPVSATSAPRLPVGLMNAPCSCGCRLSTGTSAA